MARCYILLGQRRRVNDGTGDIGNSHGGGIPILVLVLAPVLPPLLILLLLLLLLLSSLRPVTRRKHSEPRGADCGGAGGDAEQHGGGVGVMGTKLGMMTYFEPEGGAAVPVTVVGFREGNVVTQLKTAATDGYDAVQIGYRRVRDTKLTRPELGHLRKAGAAPMRHLQEFRLRSLDGLEPGQALVLDHLFKEGDLVDVSANSIGKGFQGGIKRHNFRRGPMTHGSKSHRALGSIGAGTTPGRVYKGKKMPGRLGGTKTKIRKLKIVKIDSELRVVMIKGSVPGKPGNLLRIAPAKIVGKNIPKS
uniref:Large ribosomal subunit protein uL3c n=1 Tax=Ananas comosus var. bracteatus TaxID=296719 RepID=A0A6V7PGN9_ANACO|nr:unnamed protein product [Ananas comosus var. bracteatus]